MFISDISIKRPVLATMMIAALVLFGFISRDRMGLALYPDVDFPIVTITTTLQGASPDVIETEVTDVIEESISSVEGIKHISSSSSYGVSRVTVEFELERDIDIAAQDIRDNISLANRLLPRDADSPAISKVDISAHPIIWIGVSGNLPRRDLGVLADEVFKPRFETLPGVGSVMIGGLQKREMRVWLDLKKMEAYHVTFDDVERAIADQNLELPGGRIESRARELLVKTMGTLEDEAAFNNLIVSYFNGAPIRLRDIGVAEDGVEDRRSVGRFQGVNAIGMGMIPISGTNHVDMCDRVKETMIELREIAPDGVSLNVAFDSSDFIKNSIADVQFDVFFGGLLAAFVVFLFLRSFGPTLIIAIAIPTSLIGTFSVMYALGFTMNTMTMLAFSLCVGLVIDDAIVVLENVFRHGEMKKGAFDAARDGSREIAFAVVASTVSIVAVFIPVAFMEGIVGRFYFQFGVTVSVAVMISTFVSLSLTPMLFSRFITVDKRRGVFYDILERAFLYIEGIYKGLLGFSLNHRLLVIAGAFLAFVLSLGFFGLLGVELVQTEDRDDFVARIECTLGTSLELADKKLAQCEEIILAMPELKSVFALMGATGPAGATNKGFIFITLTGSRERTRSQNEVMSYLRDALNDIPGLVAYVEDLTVIGGGMRGRSAPLEFKIKGPELSELARISRDTMNRLRQIEGLVDIGSDMELTTPEVWITVDRDKAADLDVDVRTIASAVNTLIGGREVGKFKHGGRSYDVRVRLIPGQRRTPEDISNILVRNRNGKLIRLGNIVSVSEAVGPNVINRYDRLRSITIYANLEAGKILGDAVQDTRRIVEETVPHGYSIEFAGQAETMAETAAAFIFAFILTILITYIVLASQFESFVHPFTVMLALPLSFVGALGFIYLSGNTLNIMSLIGILMLIGLVVKNSILLVDYTNKLRERGMGLYEAVLTAGPVRFRPIMMTAISTIAGVLPVAIGMGAGGEARAPMAIAVIGGLTTSTLLTLIVVPVVYTLIDSLFHRKSKEKTVDPSNMMNR